MERLTIKNSDGSYSQPTHTTFEKLFYKVAEIEDFMEKHNIESVEEFDTILLNYKQQCLICDKEQENEQLKRTYRELDNDFWELERENKELKKQLKKAIVPRFKVGQEVFILESFVNVYGETIVPTEVEAILITKDGLFYETQERNLESEDVIFATKEEAEKKLEELKNERN